MLPGGARPPGKASRCAANIDPLAETEWHETQGPAVMLPAMARSADGDHVANGSIITPPLLPISVEPYAS